VNLNDLSAARMRHNQNYDENVCRLKSFKKEHELLAVNLQPLMDKKWNAK